MPEYTLAAVGAVLTVVMLEVWVLRTGLLREPRYWGTVAIALAFQIPVDGLLTREGSIVSYREEATLGIRWPWSIPVEDFAFGYALVTLALLMWRWNQRRAGARRV